MGIVSLIEGDASKIEVEREPVSGDSEKPPREDTSWEVVDPRQVFSYAPACSIICVRMTEKKAEPEFALDYFPAGVPPLKVFEMDLLALQETMRQAAVARATETKP